MAEQVKITNLPDSGSAWRVSYQLMETIAHAEFLKRGNKLPDDPRSYYLTLFKECQDTMRY